MDSKLCDIQRHRQVVFTETNFQQESINVGIILNILLTHPLLPSILRAQSLITSNMTVMRRVLRHAKADHKYGLALSMMWKKFVPLTYPIFRSGSNAFFVRNFSRNPEIMWRRVSFFTC